MAIRHEINSPLAIIQGKATMLVTLLNNAHYAASKREEKWVRLRVEKGNEFLRVFVTDSGSRIPEDHVDRIMQPFFTTKEVGQGTGLGLSISKGIIEVHGGRLRVDRDCPNTSFVIDLPLKHQGS